jgi:hypothetical protein
LNAVFVIDIQSSVDGGEENIRDPSALLLYARRLVG